MSSSTSTTDAREERITQPIDVVEGINKEIVQTVYDHLPEDVKSNIPISNPTEVVMDRIEQIKQQMRERLVKPQTLDAPTSSTLDSEDETEEHKAQTTKAPGSFSGKSVFENAVTGFTKRPKVNVFRSWPKKPHNASESDIVLIGNDCDVTESDDVDELCFDSMEKSRVEQIFEDKQKKYSQEISHRLAEINRLGIELENFGECKQPILDTTAKLQKQARTICGCTHSLEMEITRIKYEVGGIIPISPSDNLTCGDFCIKGIVDKVIELQQKVEKIRSRAALKSAFLSMCNASRCRISRQNKGLKKDIQKAIQIVKEYEVEFKTIKSSIVKGVVKKPAVKNRRVTTGFCAKGNKETDTKESDYDDDEDEGAAGYQFYDKQQNEWNGSTFSRNDQDEPNQHEFEQFQKGSYNEYSAANDFELQSYDDFGTDFSENETRYRGGKERSQTKTQSKSSTNDGSEGSIHNAMPEEKQIDGSNTVEANNGQAKTVCFTITTSSSHRSSKSQLASQARSLDSRDFSDENNSDNHDRPQCSTTGQTASGRQSLNYTRNTVQTQRVSRTRETYLEISEAESAHRTFLDQVKHMDCSKLRQSRNLPTCIALKAEKNRACVVKPYSPRRPSPRPSISSKNENVDCRYVKPTAYRWNIDDQISGTERRASAERKNRCQVASCSNSPIRGKSGDNSTSTYKRTVKIETTCRCPASSPGKRCLCPNCKCATQNQSVRKPKPCPGRCCDCTNCICINQTVPKAQQKTNIQQKNKESKKRVCMCPGNSPGTRCPCSNCTCGERGSTKTYENGVDPSSEHSQTSLRRWQRRRESGRKNSGLCICSPRRGLCKCADCKCKPTPEIYVDDFGALDDDISGKPGTDLPRFEDEFPRNRRKSPSFFEDDISGKRRRDSSIHGNVSGTRRNNSPSSDVTGVKSVSQQSIVISGSCKSLSSECKCLSTDYCSSSECTHKSKAKIKICVSEDARKSARTSKGREYERSRSATRSKSSHWKDRCRFSSICRCLPGKRKSLGHISSSRSVNTSKSTDKSSTDLTGIYRRDSSATPQNPTDVKSTESSSNENSRSKIKDYYTSQFESSSKSGQGVEEESAKQFESKEHENSWSSSLSQSLHGNKSNKSSSFCSCPPDEDRCIIKKSISNSTNISRALSEYGSDQTSPRRKNRSRLLPEVSSLVDNFAESSSYCMCSSTGRSENYICAKRKYDSESRLGLNSGVNRRNTNSETITKNVSDWSKTTDSSHITIGISQTSREDYFRSNNGKPIKSSIGCTVCECQSTECLGPKSSYQLHQSSKSGKNSASFDKDSLEKRESDVRKRVSAGSSYCHCDSSGKSLNECVCDDLKQIPEEMESQKSLKTGSKRFSSDRKSIYGDTVWPSKDPSIGKTRKSLSICKCSSSGDKPCPECTCDKKRDKPEIYLSQGSTENLKTIKSFTSAKKSDLSSNFSRFSTEKVIDSFHHSYGKDGSEKSTTITIDKTFIREDSRGKTSTSVTIEREPLTPEIKVTSKEQFEEPGFKPAKKPDVSRDLVRKPSQEPDKTVPSGTTVVPSIIPSEKPVTSPSAVPSKQPEPDKPAQQSISKVPIGEPSSQSKPKVDGTVTPDKEKTEKGIFPSKKPSITIQESVPPTEPYTAQSGLPPTIPEVKDKQPSILSPHLKDEQPGKLKSRDTLTPAVDGTKEASPEKLKAPDFSTEITPPSHAVPEKLSIHSTKVPGDKPEKLKSKEKLISSQPSKNATIVTDGSKPVLPDKSAIGDKQPDAIISRKPDHLQQETIPSKNIGEGFPSTGTDKTQKGSPSTPQEGKISDKRPFEYPDHLKDEKPGKIRSRDVVLPPAVDDGKGVSPEKPKPADLGTEINPPSKGVPAKSSILKVPKDMPGKLLSKEEIPRKPTSQDKKPSLDDRKETATPQSVTVPGKEPSRNLIKTPDAMPLVDKLKSEEKFAKKIPAIVPTTPAKGVTTPNAAKKENEPEPLVDLSKHEIGKDKPTFVHPEKQAVPPVESPNIPQSDTKTSIPKITTTTPIAKQPLNVVLPAESPKIPQPDIKQTIPNITATPPAAKQPDKSDQLISKTPQSPLPNQTLPQPSKPSDGINNASPITPNQTMPNNVAKPPQATVPNQEAKQPGKVPANVYDPLISDANSIRDQLKTCQENLLKYETENTKLLYEAKMADSERQKMLNEINQLKKKYDECLADNVTNKTTAQQMLGLQTENSDLKKELNNMKVLLEQLQRRNDAQIDNAKKGLDEIPKYSEKPPNASVDCSQYIQKISLLETQLATITRQNESNLKEFSECKANLDKCQDNLTKCYKELSKDPPNIAQGIVKPVSPADCQEWIDLAKKYEAQLKEYQVNTVRSSFMSKMVDRERNELKNERDDLKIALQKCQDDLKKCLAEQKGAPLQSQVDLLTSELQKLKALNEKQELAKAELMRQKEEAMKDVSKAQEKLKQYELEIQMVATGNESEIGEQYAKMRSENNRLIAELDEKKREMDKMLSSLESYRTRWNECKSKLERYGEQLDSKSYTQLLEPITQNKEPKEPEIRLKPTVDNNLADGDRHKVQVPDFKEDMKKCPTAAEQANLQNQLRQHRKDVKEMQKLYENLQCLIQKVIHKLNCRPCCENVQGELAKIFLALNCMKQRICSCSYDEQEIEFNPQCIRGEDPVVHRICLQVVISGIRSLNFKQLIYLHCTIYRIGTNFGKTNCSRFPCEQFRCLSSNSICNKDEGTEKEKIIKAKKISFEKIKLLECEMDRTKKLLKNFKKCCN